jgi:protein disulfide-isomerase A6
MALLHGGYADLVDFEQAVLNGDAANYHDTHGFGSPPPLKKKEDAAPAEAPEPAESETAKAPEEQATATATPNSEPHVGKSEFEL